MSAPAAFRLEVTHKKTFAALRPYLAVGRRFLFRDGGTLPQQGRFLRRLLRATDDTPAPREVLALLEQPVSVPGATVTPEPLDTEPIACLVTDRDLYRAEEDTVHLFVAAAGSPPDLKIVVEHAGQPFTERPLDPEEIPTLKTHGVHVEPLAMLLPGPYTAQLVSGERRLGPPVRFTVAEYTLAPLSAMLTSHALDRAENALHFNLAVESYQRPYDRPLVVDLVEDDDVLASVELEAEEPGRYEGTLPISGEGALRLRLQAKDDPERVCEVVIPGSRKTERDQTTVSDLGDEVLLSLMPEPNAIPIRGAFLTRGDFVSSPVTIDEVVTETGRLRVRTDVERLTTITWDLATRTATVTAHGDLAKDAEIEIPVPSAAVAVFVGCFAAGKPFEGVTHLFRPQSLKLTVQAEHDADAAAIRIELSVKNGSATTKRPVLLCVRDERLTATDTPEVGLSASTKRAIAGHTAPPEDGRGVVSLGDPDWEWLGRYEHEELVEGEGWAPGLSLQPVDVWHRADAFPLRFEGGEVTIAMARPNEERARHLLRRLGSGVSIQIVHADADEIRATIEQAEVESTRLTMPGFAALGMPPDEVQFSGPPQSGGFLSALFGSGSAGVLRSAPMPPPRLGAAPPPASAPMDYAPATPMSLAPQTPDAWEGSVLEQADRLTLAGRGLTRVGCHSEVHAVVELEERGDLAGLAAEYFELDAGAAIPADAPVRDTFPEVLFYGLVEVEGNAVVELPLADSLGTFAVEAFCLSGAGADWAQVRETVTVDRPLRVDLDVPPAVHPEDTVYASVRAAAASGGLRLELLCDGEPVEVLADDGTAVAPDAELPSPFEGRFLLRPGAWTAQVEDTATTKKDVVEVLVGEPGEVRSYVRELGLLTAGDRISLEEAGPDVLSLRVLPALDEPFGTLMRATARYAHLCCEQTAAKILSACAMLLSAQNAGDRKKASMIIVAGIQREKTMFQPGRGFEMYPGCGSVSEHYSKLAVRYLWKLGRLADVPGLTPAVVRAVKDGLGMADDAGLAHELDRMPKRIAGAEDAYRMVSGGGDADEATRWIASRFDLQAETPAPRTPQPRVQERVELSYAAATLLACGDLMRGVRVANVVTRQLNEAGRLYSTVDSVAAIALLTELERSGVAKGEGTLVVNGEEMAVEAACALGDQIQSLEVKSGSCAVQVLGMRTDRWEDYDASFKVRVGFRDQKGEKTRTFQAGDRAELRVELPEGYQNGDLVHVCLPAAMAWIKGGGRVQQFTVDLEGETEVRIPVLVTSAIEGQQRFAICVRNMFEEERVSSPGLLKIEAA